MSDKNKGWRTRTGELRSVWTNVRKTFALVHQGGAALLWAMLALQLVDAITTVAIAYVGKQIIDAVIAALARGAGRITHVAASALVWVGVEFALVAVRSLVAQGQNYTSLVLRSRLGLHVNVAILEKASNVAYWHFEDPEFINRMTQARREATARPVDLVMQVLSLVRSAITLAGYATLLAGLGGWAVVALVVTALPPFFAEARFGDRYFALQRARTARNRRAFYFENVLTSEQTAKEVKLFSLARWLIDRYRDVHEGFHHEEVAFARSRSIASFALGLVATAALYAVYASIALRAVAGALTIGSMTLYVTVFRSGQSMLQSALGSLARLYEDNLFMTNLFEYLGVPDDEPDRPIDPALPPPSEAMEVRFENVTFRYAGAERDALTDVNLTFHAGETVALVGRNGAGKTTLVKLLVGLHAPTHGRIMIDGVDAATLGAAEMRRRIGVIFQDFARYQFSAQDNVGVGWLPSLSDRAAVDRAVDDAGAREVIDRLPRGLDTPLGRAFGGDDLSVGQWQRMALARAFMRRSPLLVLDEPTAAMDAEAEHEIFQRLRDLKRNRTALLITHRFSTVRMADRIVVFEGGRVVEEGRHGELIALGGRYATMFNLQAAGYLDDDQGAPSADRGA